MKTMESDLQKAIFRYVAYAKNVHPDLDLLFHIPNGEHRNIKTAMKLKAMGVKPGIPDLFYPVSHQGKHGLWMELKAGKNGLTEHQKRFMERMENAGYAVHIVRTVEEFAETMAEYTGNQNLVKMLG